MSLEECVERPRTAFRATYVRGMKLSRLYNIRILSIEAQEKLSHLRTRVQRIISVNRPGLVRG
jgi:hypothetical protein